jgi:hypothetical protein
MHATSANATFEEQVDVPASIGFVFELDNIRNAERWRAHAMLEQLVTQLGRMSNRLAAPAQLVIVFDPNVVPEAEVREFLSQHDLAGRAYLEHRVLPHAGLGYYAQKNFGVRYVERDIVFLIDSDIVVEDDWLAQLLEAFDDPSVQIAFGDVRLETGTSFEKAFALMTPAFAMRQSSAECEAVDAFLANNVAFRKAAFPGDLFPHSEAYRGHCRVASDRITAEGGKIYRVNGARGLHPAPNGLRHFVLRALVEGHDELVLIRAGHSPKWWRTTLIGSCGRFARAVLRSAASILGPDGRKVGLKRAEAPKALGLAISYFFLRFCGEIATHVNPKLIRDHGIH